MGNLFSTEPLKPRGPRPWLVGLCINPTLVMGMHPAAAFRSATAKVIRT
jgi:hypothetical protein